jgi:hypothetical protein
VSRTIRRPIAPPQGDGAKIALGTEASDAEIDDLHDSERMYRMPSRCVCTAAIAC